jgi:hypothetical protein
MAAMDTMHASFLPHGDPAATPTSPTKAIRFEAEMRKIGRSTIVRLPDDASARLPSRGQIAVKGVMNRHAFEQS